MVLLILARLSDFPCHVILVSIMTLHGMSLRSWDTAFAIYVTAGVLIDVAVLYCLMQGADNAELCREVLELRYLSEPLDTLNAILDGTGPWQRVKGCVDDWLVEHRLHEWIRVMNEIVGVAPSYESVFCHYKTLCTHRSDLDSIYLKPESRRKWVQRFMAKWQSSRGCIHSHEAESQQAVAGKVRPEGMTNRILLRFGNLVLGTALVPKTGVLNRKAMEPLPRIQPQN